MSVCLQGDGEKDELTDAFNQITFLGLCFVFANVATLLVFDVKYAGTILPSWVYLR